MMNNHKTLLDNLYYNIYEKQNHLSQDLMNLDPEVMTVLTSHYIELSCASFHPHSEM